MNRTVRSLAELVLHAAPRRTHPGDRLILAYHNVVDASVRPTGDQSLHLSVEDFDRQLLTACSESDVVPLGELLASAGGTKSRRDRLVAVTFDDAYESAMTIGLQVCARHAIAATVFVAPGLLGKLPPWDMLALVGEWTEERRRRFLWEESGQLGPDSGREIADIPAHLLLATQPRLQAVLAGSEHTVGNHTFDHVNLGAITPQRAHDQTRRADEWLRRHFGDRSIPVLSYPYGIPPKNPQDSMLGTSMSFALCVSGGWIKNDSPADRLAVPRWNVPAGISHRGYGLRLRGWFSNR